MSGILSKLVVFNYENLSGILSKLVVFNYENLSGILSKLVVMHEHFFKYQRLNQILISSVVNTYMYNKETEFKLLYM